MKEISRNLTLALLALFVSWSILPLAHATGDWSPTGSLNNSRWDPHTATLLDNGKVLVAGGNFDYITELYDPATGTWANTGSMSHIRRFHTATLLANGKVLVAGGYDQNYGQYGYYNHLQTAEIYDPSTGTWSPTGSMTITRAHHTATLLANGKVLVVGGSSYGRSYNTISSAELYDPVTETWSSTGSMSTSRYHHTATLLNSGHVLLAGGSNDWSGNLLTTELYNPSTGTWTLTGPISTGRHKPTATLLGNGKVLLAGGNTSAAELYDPAAGTWSPTGSTGQIRFKHAATLMANGQVLVVGGGDTGPDRSSEIYNPALGTWTATDSIAVDRLTPTATLLADGRVLVVGNSISTELYSYFITLTLDTMMHGSITGNLSQYLFGSTATLNANPAPGYLFTGWTGGASGIANPLSLSMTEDKTIGANFVQDNSDTDDDGLTNYQEIVEYGTDPTKQDTDGDGVNDFADSRPLDPTETLDTDADGIGDNADTDDDGDGLSDEDEISTHGTNSKRADSDGDGLSDPDELQTHLTNPNLADTDGDGLSDGAEFLTHHTNPKEGDTDGDGFLDGYEVLTGKSPLNILDKPALVAEARTAIEFTFPSALGKTYRIEDSLDLTNWDTVESGIVGNGGQIQRFYSTRSLPKRYFRVEEDGP